MRKFPHKCEIAAFCHAWSAEIKFDLPCIISSVKTKHQLAVVSTLLNCYKELPSLSTHINIRRVSATET